MKIEDAIKTVEARKCFVAEVNITALESYDMAIAALEKKIPKTVIIEKAKADYERDAYSCPTCKTDLMYTEYPHCYGCGQALNWF